MIESIVLMDNDLLVEDNGVRFSDIIGHDEAIANLQLIVKLMQKKHIFTKMKSVFFNKQGSLSMPNPSVIGVSNQRFSKVQMATLYTMMNKKMRLFYN